MFVKFFLIEQFVFLCFNHGMREFNLKNGIFAGIKRNNNTPRIALSVNFSIAEPEKFAGQYLLMNRLLLKGTTKYSSEELSAVLEENAIDLFTEMKYDYLRYRFVCLNDDFKLALSILADIMKNSTFEEFEKERTKLKGELMAELDSAKVKISDLFTKTVYKDHFYGHSYTNVLDEIDKVSLDDVKNAYREIFENSNKTLVLVGDIEEQVAENLLNKYLGNLPTPKSVESQIPEPSELKNEYVELVKEDAQQAQIIQGWLVPTIGSEDYHKIMLLNIILGASGLSSRLFLELREKKGLAYTVRTSYETHLKSAVFSIYIGTEPSNIATSIEGFKEEIEKIKNVEVGESELQNAINNLIGKQQFVTETNSQQANLMAYYAISGKPLDYQKYVIDSLKKVTPKDLKECANKYFTDNYVLAVLKP